MKFNVRMETLLTALALTLALGILASLEQSLGVSRGSQHRYRIAQATQVEGSQRSTDANLLQRLRSSRSPEPSIH